jgi:hypothetical protein
MMALLYKKKANDQYIYQQSYKNDVCIQPISDSSYTNCKLHPFRHGYEYFMKFNILNTLLINLNTVVYH